MCADIPADQEFVASHRKVRRLPASARGWLTRQEVLAEYPFAYSTLANIPTSILPRVRGVGVNVLYERSDVEALLTRLNQIELQDLLARVQANGNDPELDALRGLPPPVLVPVAPPPAQAPQPNSRRGRPPKPVIGR